MLPPAISAATIAPAPDVYCQTLSGEAVLLDTRGGVYFGLDAVGTRVWELLAQGMSLGAVTVALLAEYQVERETLEQDLISFVDTLQAKGLIRRLSPGAAGSGHDPAEQSLALLDG